MERNGIPASSVLSLRWRKLRQSRNGTKNANHPAGVGQNICRYELQKISREILWSCRAAFMAHSAVLLASVLLPSRAGSI